MKMTVVVVGGGGGTERNVPFLISGKIDLASLWKMSSTTF
jgi:hypothetical protein